MPMMSTSPARATPSRDRCASPRLPSSVPVPVDAGKLCGTLDGVVLAALTRLITPWPCACGVALPIGLALARSMALTWSGRRRVWPAAAARPRRTTTAAAWEVPLPRKNRVVDAAGRRTAGRRCTSRGRAGWRSSEPGATQVGVAGAVAAAGEGRRPVVGDGSSCRWCRRRRRRSRTGRWPGWSAAVGGRRRCRRRRPPRCRCARPPRPRRPAGRAVGLWAPSVPKDRFSTRMFMPGSSCGAARPSRSRRSPARRRWRRRRSATLTLTGSARPAPRRRTLWSCPAACR